MKIYQITSSENNLIQSYEYEIRALKDIVRFLSNECRDNEKLINEHIEMLKSKTEESLVAKDSIIEKYHTNKKIGYEIDFKTGILKVYEGGELNV